MLSEVLILGWPLLWINWGWREWDPHSSPKVGRQARCCWPCFTQGNIVPQKITQPRVKPQAPGGGQIPFLLPSLDKLFTSSSFLIYKMSPIMLSVHMCLEGDWRKPCTILCSHSMWCLTHSEHSSNRFDCGDCHCCHSACLPWSSLRPRSVELCYLFCCCDISNLQMERLILLMLSEVLVSHGGRTW